MWSLATLTLLGTAPAFLLRRPSTIEVAQCSVAIKWVLAGRLHFTACSLDTASSADVAIHLHLAVGQSAFVALGTKDMIGHPVDTILAFGGFTTQSALRITLQR